VADLTLEYPPAHHFLRDLGVVSEQLSAERSLTVAPVSEAERSHDGRAALGFLVTLTDINAALVALIAGAPDWTATADLALHTTGGVAGRSAIVDSRLVRAGSNLVIVTTDIYDGGDADDPHDSLDHPDRARPSGATGLVTFARIPRKASAASDDFDPAEMVGQRRELVAGGGPPNGEPIFERVGLEVVDPAAGVVDLHRCEYVRNSFGAINGGVLGLVFQGAAEATVPGHVATDLQIHYLAQAREGPVRTASTVLRQDGDHALCSVAARDAGRDDTLLALATVGLAARRLIARRLIARPEP
jgi:acyl-coenzyme A thioesterase PaaI-like protein